MPAPVLLRRTLMVAVVGGALGLPLAAEAQAPAAQPAPVTAPAAPAAAMPAAPAAVPADAAKAQAPAGEPEAAARKPRSNVLRPMFLGLMSGAVLGLVVYAWGRMTMKKDKSETESAAG